LENVIFPLKKVNESWVCAVRRSLMPLFTVIYITQNP